MVGDFAVQARNVGKCYHIYNQPLDRLKQSLWRGRKNYYQEFWALREVTFGISRGETIGIIGANGSGKSTLLQLICSILNPTEGELKVAGRVASLLELGAGFNLEFTGKENVYMNAAIMGLNKKETDSRYEEIAAFANIGGFINQPVKTYSSGMYVRLAFAVAVNVSPDILVVDEALSVGDARFQQKCIAKIKDFCRTGTVIFVSHDMTAITELSSRVFWIEKGRVRMEGIPKLVVEKYLEYMYEGDLKEESTPQETSLPSETMFNISDFSQAEEIRQFGDRRVTIESVGLLCQESRNGVAYAGRQCEISIGLNAHEDIVSPIVGYIVKDRLGRVIFGENTALMRYPLPKLSAGKKYTVSFQIESWPNLLDGEYALATAIADGTMENHVQCHYLHDALIIQSVSLRPSPGIFSLPNTEVIFKPMGDCNASELSR